MRKNKLVLAYMIFGLISMNNLNADVLSFDEVWAPIAAKSDAKDAVKLTRESTKLAIERASYKWRPKVMADVQTYQTNDPGYSFMGLLEQRSVHDTDFDPKKLNDPSEGPLTRGLIHVDLALYEGGEKDLKKAVLSHKLDSEKWQEYSIQTEEYAQTVLSYGSIAVIQKQKKTIRQLKDQINALMKGYQLGQKTNPVGYSGLLGMKSLMNRIDANLEQLNAQETAYYAVASALGFEKDNWTPKIRPVDEFIEEVAPLVPKNQPVKSYQVLASEEGALMLYKTAELEKTRFKPRASAYLQSMIFNGSRNTTGMYTMGAYVQWLIHDPAEKNADKEYELEAKAAEKYTSALQKQEQAKRKQSEEMEKALKANLIRLNQSDALLTEQIQVSQTLFNNGSISALQFVEILNRRLDLIVEQTEAQLQLVKTAASRLVTQPVSFKKAHQEVQ